MARLNNDLFNYLKSRGIFKGWDPTGKASEKTEDRNRSRNRGIMVWLSKGWRTDSVTKERFKIGSGTYIRQKHGQLKYSKPNGIN